MKTLVAQVFVAISIIAFSASVNAKSFSAKLCKQDGYKCYKVKRGDTWKKLFPAKADRDVVKRINRMNTRLRRGKVIALPTSGIGSHMDHAPFPNQIKATGVKTIMIDKSDLAFGAYDEGGELLHWGPISPGKRYCADVGRGCRTPSGSFAIYRKHGSGCKSSKFPLGKGGAPMPYCMFFKGGFAMHGSPSVPGYAASHGCVRLFTEDAKWLNKEFSAGSKVKVKIRQ